MHIVVRYLVISFLANAALAQPPFAQSRDNLRIEKLVIESNSLPPADRERIVRLLQQKTYLQPEIGERIRQTLRDEGYLKAIVEEPSFSVRLEAKGKRAAYVTVKVEQGAQYRLGDIHIQKATVFLPTRLRSLFSLRRGELFNMNKFGEGLENLRKLYATRGYVNCVAAPVVSIDESRRTIDLVLEVDEGRPFDFGKLNLEGIEAYPGASKTLLNSWKPLEGKRYNSVELEHWLQANHSDWKVGPRASDSIKMAQDPFSLVVNVTLTKRAH
jgi:outer membrane translocation and assembly module TamA